MLISNYDINSSLKPQPFSSATDFLYKILVRLYNATHIHLQWGIVLYFRRRIFKNLKKLLIASAGLKDVLKEVSEQEALALYEPFKQTLFEARQRYSRWTQEPLLCTPVVIEMYEIYLDNLYDIEFELRTTAFPNKEASNEDQILQEFASSLSLSSLPEQ